MQLTKEQVELYCKLQTAYQKFGFKWLKGSHNYNIIGIRTDLSNKYNDILVVIELNNSGLVTYMKECKCATHPGIGWLGTLMGNPNGTFILKADEQYNNCWEIRKHKGQYDALCQVYGYKGFRGYRDSNKNGVCDLSGSLYNDVQGLNLHTTSFIGLVNMASAGCQVIQDSKNFNELMSLFKDAEKSFEIGRFSYTLFNKDTVWA